MIMLHKCKLDIELLPCFFKIEISDYDKFLFCPITIEVCDNWSWQNVWVNIDAAAIWW